MEIGGPGKRLQLPGQLGAPLRRRWERHLEPRSNLELAYPDAMGRPGRQGRAGVLEFHRQVAGIQTDLDMFQQPLVRLGPGDSRRLRQQGASHRQQPVLIEIHHLPAPLQQAVGFRLQIQVDQDPLLPERHELTGKADQIPGDLRPGPGVARGDPGFVGQRHGGNAALHPRR
jgi:hypothetical protein